MWAKGALEPERQLVFLWATVAIALIALSPAAPSQAEGLLPSCPLKTLTGLPCPACGSTRAALALAHWEVEEAVAVNPLATLAWLGLVAGGLVAGVAVVTGWSPREPRWVLALPARLGVVALVAANWVYLIAAGT